MALPRRGPGSGEHGGWVGRPRIHPQVIVTVESSTMELIPFFNSVALLTVRHHCLFLPESCGGECGN